MNALEYAQFLLGRWKTILVATLLGFVLAGGYLLLQTPQFQSESSVVVSATSTANLTDFAAAQTVNQQAAQTYAKVATSPLVLDTVSKQVKVAGGYNALVDKIDVTVPLDTSVLQITATDSSPQGAQALAKATAVRLTTVIPGLSPNAGNAASVVKAVVIEPATTSLVPSSPSYPYGLLIGALAGFAIAVIALSAIRVFDTRVRVAKDLRRAVDVPLLGLTQFDDSARRSTSPLMLRASGRRQLEGAEIYRKIAANMAYLEIENPHKLFVVSSPAAGDGKSTVLLNTALALAATEAKVLVVDADLRRPSIARMLGVLEEPGLTDVLVTGQSFSGVVQRLDSGLHVIGSGSLPPNPAELLQSSRMRDFLAAVRAEYDVVLVDTPPTSAAADGTVLARETDGAILVARAARTRSQDLRASLAGMQQIGAKVVGVVLAAVARNASGQADYYGEEGPVQRATQPGRGARRESRPAGEPDAAPMVEDLRVDPRPEDAQDPAVAGSRSS